MIKQDIHGILLLDKPTGITSNRALQKVKQLFNAKKAGHTGSLDPLASGLLPICFGEATKFSQYLLNADKTYQVTAKLGVQTDTADSDGQVINTASIPALSKEKIEATLANMLGKSQQIPPMYSALKHHGQPLYKLARKGKEVTRKPREITLHHLSLLDFTQDTITLSVHCSKGTYIRVLIEDFAKKLSTLAHVTHLRRTNIRNFPPEKMQTLASLTLLKDQLSQHLLPIDAALTHFPVLPLDAQSATSLHQGQHIQNHPHPKGLYRLKTPTNRFLGLAEITPDSTLRPLRLCAQNTDS